MVAYGGKIGYTKKIGEGDFMRLSSLKKQAAIAAVGILLSASLSCAVYAGQWKLEMDQNWYYYDDAGKKLTKYFYPFSF